MKRRARQLDIDPEEYDAVEGAEAVIVADRSNGRRRVLHASPSISGSTVVGVSLATALAVIMAVWGAAWKVNDALHDLRSRTADRWGGTHEAVADATREALNTPALIQARGYKGIGVGEIRNIQRSISLQDGGS